MEVGQLREAGAEGVGVPLPAGVVVVGVGKEDLRTEAVVEVVVVEEGEGVEQREERRLLGGKAAAPWKGSKGSNPATDDAAARTGLRGPAGPCGGRWR